MTEKSCTRKAYAKINLGLDVLRHRADGYHEVRMVMQTVDLYDEVTVTVKDAPGIMLSCDAPGVPVDARNLACRAAAVLTDAFSLPCGVHIDLKKRIPAAAGMAGGSSDAAAVLHAVNELFALGLDNEALAGYGVRLGADVPYCVYGGTMLAEGIGERLTRVTQAPTCGVLIAKPELEVSTKEVYENLHVDELRAHPDIDGLLASIAAQDVDGIASRLGNVLETVTAPTYPVIGQLKTLMVENGAKGALMSGSGPTVFGLFRQKEDGQKAFEAVKRSGLAKDLFLTAVSSG